MVSETTVDGCIGLFAGQCCLCWLIYVILASVLLLIVLETRVFSLDEWWNLC